MRKRVTKREARRVGKAIGIKFSRVGTKRRPSLEEFRRGMVVEFEHGRVGGRLTNVTNDDPIATGRIALAHLRERPDYYKLLQRFVEGAHHNPCVAMARVGKRCVMLVRVLGYYVVMVTASGVLVDSFKFKSQKKAKAKFRALL